MLDQVQELCFYEHQATQETPRRTRRTHAVVHSLHPSLPVPFLLRPIQLYKHDRPVPKAGASKTIDH